MDSLEQRVPENRRSEMIPPNGWIGVQVRELISPVLGIADDGYSSAAASYRKRVKQDVFRWLLIVMYKWEAGLVW